MSNKKHAFLIPVVTLAVCAIAMVGLGFALTTSVTSNVNDLEQLMIDLDDDHVALGNQEAPDGTIVDSLFDYRITSNKSVSNGDITINYKLEYDKSYLKIFSNISNKTATLKVTGGNVSNSGTITKVVLGLYETNNGSTSGNAKAYAEITSGTEATFAPSSGTYVVKTDTVYIVQIESITIDGITYLSGNTGISITKSGSTYTYSDGTTSSSVTGFPEFKNTYNALTFTFTAYADPEA